MSTSFRRVGSVFSRQLASTVTNVSRRIACASSVGTNGKGQALSRTALISAALFLFPLVLAAQNVLTWHNDNSRTGQNLKETTLTLANVNSTAFGKKFTLSVDGEIFAQPLYVANVSIAGQGTHNVVYVATENDTVYAFDAGGSSTTPLWQNALASGTGVTAVPCGNTGSCEISPVIGISGTPVIDGTTKTLYVVTFTLESGNYFQRLHALDITSGAEKFGGPVVIQASVSGTGVGSSGGTITFNPLVQNERSALLLSNGVVYIAWASFGDLNLYHGWVMGYSAATLAQVSVFNDTPNGSQGGIWQGAGGLSADSTGNVFVITGNGTFDANLTGGLDYGDSFLKMTTTSGLVVADYFSPDNELTLDDDDEDLGASSGVILPTQSGTHPHEITGAGKQGIIYLVNRDNLGQFNSGSNNVVQQITGAASGYNSTPAYFNKAVYYSGEEDYVRRYTLAKGMLSKASVSKSATTLAVGGTPSISANGTANGIVWVIDASPKKGTIDAMHAYEASNLGVELYNTQQNATRDSLGSGIRFSVPTVANGNVYVASRNGATNSLLIYGLLN